MQHGFCSLMILFWIDVMNEQTQFVYPSRTSRNTYGIGDLFTRVKSVKHMVKSKTKSISSLGAFSNFSKTALQSIIFSKFLQQLFVLLWSVGAERVSKTPEYAFVHRYNWFISMKLVWLIQIAGWSADQRNLQMSAESLPLSLLI